MHWYKKTEPLMYSYWTNFPTRGMNVPRLPLQAVFFHPSWFYEPPPPLSLKVQINKPSYNNSESHRDKLTVKQRANSTYCTQKPNRKTITLRVNTQFMRKTFVKRVANWLKLRIYLEKWEKLHNKLNMNENNSA